MVGIDFTNFLILLTISVVASATLHFGFDYHITPGMSSLFSKVAIGWVGGLLGSMIWGPWWEGPIYGQVYYVPAILGCLALLVVVVNLVKTYGSVSNGRA